MEGTDQAIVIGAGPAGLAMAACLRQAGVPYTVLEQEAQLGWAWRNHYERLHLHTVKEHSALPYLPFPDDYPRYIPRQRVVDYLDVYAATHGIQPVCSTTVTRVCRGGGCWTVETSNGGYSGAHVVICTGYNRRPVIPIWPGQDDFGGTILHSRDYRNGSPFEGKRVLVVGIGNTGGEIAIDLHEHGALPSICVRGPINVVPRDTLGTPAQVSAILLEKLPAGISNAIANTMKRIFIGDLTAYGITIAKSAPNADINERGRVPLLDVGTLGLIKKGAITVVPGIERFTATGVVVSDGSEHAFDAVVLATGYRPALDDFLDDAEELVDDRGYPRTLDGPALPGLYFLGFKNPPTGFLRQIAIDSQAIAALIAGARD